jgi:predicted GNAT superfamily acetyltransferase
MLMAIAHAGGVILAAADTANEGRFISFNFAIVARLGDEYGLWSHMAGTLPAYQSMGIGKKLKFMQRDWALAHGYKRINWTTDPLQSGNANFNLRHLGATAAQYMVNHYGAMHDAINAGMETDRFEITWDLDTPHVAACAAGQIPEQVAPGYPDQDFLLTTDANGCPQNHDVGPLEKPFYFAEIPYDISAIKVANIDLAKQWQQALRQAMVPCFEKGYTVVDFTRNARRCWYTLQRTDSI